MFASSPVTLGMATHVLEKPDRLLATLVDLSEKLLMDTRTHLISSEISVSRDRHW